MKATFKNIGPIKEAELELGDLTIIAGQNNTGKTYLVYTLYGFLEAFHDDISLMTRNYSDSEFFTKMEEIAKQIKEHGKATMQFERFKTLADLMLQYSSTLFSSVYIDQVFSCSNDEFEDAEFSIKKYIKQEEMENEKHRVSHQDRESVLLSSLKDGIIHLEFDNVGNHQLTSRAMAMGLYTLFHKMIKSNFPVPFILSAERFGVSLFYKELDLNKNRLVEKLQNLSNEKESSRYQSYIEKEAARYAKPIKDNINFTRDLAEIPKRKSNLPINNLRSVERIMDGYYKTKNDEIRFISKRRGENRFDIPLHLASSSARGVSDLYFYLKHVAQQGQMLIIDEPESHLSPTNQVLMARLLAFCVNSGLKVLLTTHSDYLIKEFNNLIMLSNKFEGKDKFLARNKKDYTADDYLKPEAVKAYICEKGTLTPCEVDKTGIDMPVFDASIDSINQISNELGMLTADGDLQND
ncbi:AAA family ATPase [Candidatus Spongiihabitans sp.]|uniref:AAA family ATPase n=1 Tax=Candidatus Spongiihabitans sp. TaxID=3101308 RepID=UPI003C79F2B3